MKLHFSCEDTIVAIATPMGEGGIGIVRLSGKKSIAIAGQIFESGRGFWSFRRQRRGRDAAGAGQGNQVFCFHRMPPSARDAGARFGSKRSG